MTASWPATKVELVQLVCIAWSFWVVVAASIPWAQCRAQCLLSVSQLLSGPKQSLHLQGAVAVRAGPMVLQHCNKALTQLMLGAFETLLTQAV